MATKNCTTIVPIPLNRTSGMRWHSRMVLLLIVIVWLLGPSALAVKGQAVDYLQSVGIPEFTTQLPVEQGYISPANGDLHLEIPLGSFSQRGTGQVKIALKYDSGIWDGTCCGWNPWNVPTSQSYFGINGGEQMSGWQVVVSSDPGVVNYNITDSYFCDKTGLPYWSTFDGWDWIDPNGTTHSFFITTVLGYDTLAPPTGCGNFTSHTVPTGDALASDASGYHMYVTGVYSATVYAPDGTIVYNSGSCSQNQKDSNGNYVVPAGVNCDISGTDTLGRTPISVVANGNTLTYSVLNETGGTSTYTATKQQISVSTSFASAGSTNQEYPQSWNYQTISVIQSLQLPDGTSYTFGYDSGATAGHYGQLTSMTLPTGAQITYTYVNFADSMWAANKHITRGVRTRTTPDGVWNYVPLVLTQCTVTVQINCKQQLTVTKPTYGGRTDNVVYKFNLNGGQWPYEVDYYNGAVSPANLLATLSQSFDYSHPCVYKWCIGAERVTRIAATTTLPNVTNFNQTTQFCYDISYGNLLYKWEWNSYNGAIKSDPHPPGYPCSPLSTPDRTTTTAYLNGSTYLAKNIYNRPTTITVTNSSGTTIEQTINSYDDWALATSGATGLVHHDDTNFGSTNTVRGNLTQVKRWLNPSGSWLIAKNYYDIAGNLIQTTDPNSNNTYFDHTDNFYGVSPSPPTAAYVTKTTRPVTNGVNHIDRVQYYFGTGYPSAKCGENFPTASTCTYSLSAPQPDYDSFTYDSMNRPLITKMGDGGQTSWTYSTLPSKATSTTKIDGSHNLVSATILDGLGRTSQTQTSGGQGTIYIDTTYDSVGRLHSVSNSHLTSSLPTDGVRTYSSYDGLDRVTLFTEQDGSTSTSLFAGNCKTVTDEALKARKSCYDGFGRLTGVWEDPSGLNYETDYQYDLLDNLTSVTQGGSRQRTFTYDSLSRLLCAANPEIQIVTCPNPDTGSYTAGTIRYGYDANGNVTSKIAPKPNQSSASVTVTTAYQYDPLNRLTQKSYNDGSTPTVQYGYDAIAPANCSPGLTMNYPIGRRTAMCDAAGNEAWSYDTLGRVAQDQRTTNSVTKTTTYATPSVPYNFDGTTAQLIYPSGRTITYTPNSAAQSISAVDTANSINYATMALYTPQGALSSMLNGSSFHSTMFYNDRLQPCRFAINTTGTIPGSCPDNTNKGDVMDFTYDFHLGASDNGNVYKVSNNRTNASDRNVNYTYDSLNRIWQAYTDGNLWGETYSIDTWGNMHGIGPYSGKPAGETLSQGVNGSNQLANVCSANCYDAAGNLLNDGLHSYVYDAEGHTSTGAGVTYYYDGDGKRVRKSTGTLYWYGTSGDALDETDVSGNLTNEYIFIGGKRIARRDSSGNVFYYFVDNLGTSRSILQAGQTTPCYDQDFYPYGREVPHGSEIPAFVNTCPQNYKFTGKVRDSESVLDNFGARYDSSQYGRFTIPDWSDDPDPVPYADFGDPQTLNLYAYVRNNPVSLSDKDGHTRYCVTTYRTDEDGKSVPQVTCEDVPDSPSADDQRILDLAAQMNKRPILRFAATVYGSGAVIGATGGAVCYFLCPAATVTTVGVTVAKVAPLLPAVAGALEKLQKLGISVEEANAIVESPTSQKLIDNLNNGNINVIQDVGGKLVRITLDPSGQRIISAGLVRANQITNGIANGRFVPK